MNHKLSVNIPSKFSSQYPIYIGQQIIDEIHIFLNQNLNVRKIVIISDDIVTKLYAKDFINYLRSYDYDVNLITFEHGETNKSASTKLYIEEEMFKLNCDRSTLCLALGGGVVGDIVGFTAATYMRGLNYIQVPTSLLAMIDSSVGGKTAVNTSYGKNIIGAFWQPKAVFMDLKFLKSLPKEQIVNGFFEAVKIFLTLDKDYFKICHTNLDSILDLNDEHLIPIVTKAVELKAYVVETDEQERNLRMILNFGHTVGHALEKLSSYELLHGFGVGYGMLAEAKISQLMGLLRDEDYDLIEIFLSKLGIKNGYFSSLSVDEVINNMRGDKKNTNQEIKLVLLTAVGQVKNINNQVAFVVSEEVIADALIALKG